MLSSHAYQDYDIAMADRVIKLPSALDNVVFPGEPLGCAMNIFKRSRIASGETVAIVGIGFLGALLTMLATNAGARVFAISRRASLSTVRQFGAAENIQFTNSKEVLDRVMDLTDGGGCDCVIEAAGKQQSLDLASELTCERGRLVIAGYHQDGKRKIDLQLWNWRGLDVINAHERDPAVYLNGMSEAIEAIESGAIDPAPLYTHRFRLDELPQAFRTLTRCGEGFTKALIIL
jgi:threonine dehydrogenase-like Zn-dependent dehydrogenase